jgi:pimeloyl-ACP methyl ester carboxylesterase
MFNLEGGRMPVGGSDMDYIGFGSGSEALILIPGLGDGLKTVRGMAAPFSLMYRKIAKRFRVYSFSRRNVLPDAFSTRDMADDVVTCMDRLGLQRACVVGVSLGGMIAQQIAIRHPERVDKLVLVVTAARRNATIERRIEHWKELALRGDRHELMLDTARYMYTPEYFAKSKAMYGLVGAVTKPKSYSRLLVQADACLTHDAYDELPGITAPTLVIGGAKDETVTGEASLELASRIPNALLHIYDEYGHGAYEEASDFQDRLLAFLQGEL